MYRDRKFRVRPVASIVEDLDSALQVDGQERVNRTAQPPTAGRRIARAVLAILWVVVAGCGDDGSGAAADSCAGGTSGLRCLAAARGLTIGSAVNFHALSADTTYPLVAAREFNIVTPENEMKWDIVHPQRERYDFSRADAIVAWARRHGMEVHGHVLAWHQQNPGWLTAGSFGRDESIAILRDHIHTLVGRYRGRVAQWDVVNEAVDDSGGKLRDTLWLRRIGADYIDLAFRFAREADPNVQLFYNDYAIESRGVKFNAVSALVGDLKARAVPIDGVGFQSHVLFGAQCARCLDNLGANLRRITDLGLDVAITELDVPITPPPTDENLAAQAYLYDTALAACLSVPRCYTFVMWGFTDRYSWIPATFPPFDDALIFDRNYVPKPAYDALRMRLATLAP